MNGPFVNNPNDRLGTVKTTASAWATRLSACQTNLQDAHAALLKATMSKRDRYPPGTFHHMISGTTAIVPYIDELLEVTDVEIENMRECVIDLNQGDRDGSWRGVNIGTHWVMKNGVRPSG